MKLLLAAVPACCLAISAQADTVSVFDSVPLTATNFSSTVSVAQFDPSLGTLNSVTVTLDGNVEGQARAESLSGAAASVDLEVGANITASLTGGGGTLVNVLPSVSTTQSLSGFDGAIDFGGDSGYDSGTVTDTDQDVDTITSGWPRSWGWAISASISVRWANPRPLAVAT